MRHVSICLALLAALMLQAQAQDSVDAVFEGVNVIPMGGQPILENQTVVVQARRAAKSSLPSRWLMRFTSN